MSGRRVRRFVTPGCPRARMLGATTRSTRPMSGRSRPRMVCEPIRATVAVGTARRSDIHDPFDRSAGSMRGCGDPAGAGGSCREPKGVAPRATAARYFSLHVRMAYDRHVRCAPRPGMDNVHGRRGDRDKHRRGHRYRPSMDAGRRRQRQWPRTARERRRRWAATRSTRCATTSRWRHRPKLVARVRAPGRVLRCRTREGEAKDCRAPGRAGAVRHDTTAPAELRHCHSLPGVTGCDGGWPRVAGSR